MRMGAIFARGSCRALKWTAMLGVVFALGAAQADAQVTVTVPATVDEGGVAEVKVEAKVSIAEDSGSGADYRHALAWTPTSTRWATTSRSTTSTPLS